MSIQKITTFLSYNDQAEAAVEFYTSLFKNSSIGHKTYYPDSVPVLGGKPMTISFTLEGQPFVAMNGGPHFSFSQGISLSVNCTSQEEVDHLYDSLSEGGVQMPCAWLNDKFGVTWQIVPQRLMELMSDPDREKAARVMNAMLQMKKIDIATLELAAQSSGTMITVEAFVKASLDQVWTNWTEPEHIKQWNHASDDWHTTSAENDLQVGGKFSYRMEAKDGSFGFDFWGIYSVIDQHKMISSTLGDGRKMSVVFIPMGETVKVIESFEPENTNPVDLQKQGWQAILDNFKKYAERA